MFPIGILCWIGLVGLILLGLICILAWRAPGGGGLDITFDFVACFVLLLAGAIFASAFVPKSWSDPIHDAMLFGAGFNPAPKNPAYTPNAGGASEIDLPPIAATDEWRLQLSLVPGEDGKVQLPQDTKVQAMKAWTVDRQGTESLAVTIK